MPDSGGGGQEALGDADGHAGEAAGAVQFQVELPFEGVVDRLDQLPEFPTNLDRDQPIGGLAPETQAEVIWRALQEGRPADALDAELEARAERHITAH